MPTDSAQMELIAAHVRTALQSADLETYKDLLDPDVTWGAPDDSNPGCRNRHQVLAWYRGRADGVPAGVTETVVRGNKILVGLVVGPRDVADAGGSPRWQVLTVSRGLVSDIRGFEDRTSAIASMG